MRAANLLRRLRQPGSTMARVVQSLFVAGIAFLPVAASAGELIVHTVSVHYRSNDSQNNRNFGLGYRADTPCIRNEHVKNSIMAGAFHNTYYNPSAYAGCYFNLFEYRMLELGVMVGLVTGYDRPVMPSGLLIGTYHVTQTWSLRISFAPVTRGVANLSVGYHF